MRKKILPNLWMLMLSVILFSCNNEQIDLGLDSKQAILMSKYPHAENLAWSKSDDKKYDIASFTLPKSRSTANTADVVSVWFGGNDAIRLIKEEISFESLPQAVKVAFSKSICRPPYGISNESLLYTLYANPLVWEVDDVYLIEKDGALSYRLELETVSSIKPEVDMVLVYDAQGILMKEYQAVEIDDVKPLEVPSYILQWVDDFFPGSHILDYEMDIEDGEIEHELDLLHQNIVVEVELIEKGGLLTIEDIEFNYPNLNALPQVIREVALDIIDSLDAFTIDDVCEIEMEMKENGDEEYEIELRNSSYKLEICIIRDKDGVIRVK